GDTKVTAPQRGRHTRGVGGHRCPLLRSEQYFGFCARQIPTTTGVNHIMTALLWDRPTTAPNPCGGQGPHKGSAHRRSTGIHSSALAVIPSSKVSTFSISGPGTAR